MLADISFADILIKKSGVRNTSPSNHNKQIRLFYPCASTFRIWRQLNTCHVAKQQATKANILSTNKPNSGLGVILCPASGTTGDKIA